MASGKDIGRLIFWLMVGFSLYYVVSIPASSIDWDNGIAINKTATDGIYKVTYTSNEVKAGYKTRQVTQPIYEAVALNEQYDFRLEDGVITEVDKQYDEFL